MKTVYKVILILFILFFGINLYAINWDLGFLHQENTKFVFSSSASVLGVLAVFIMDYWSRLGKS